MNNATGQKAGVAATSYIKVWEKTDTAQFLEHCHTLGAGGIHAPINGDLAKIRRRADQFGMYIEAMVPLPDGTDTRAFERSLKDAREVGAVALRAACLGTRRYETFSTLAEWQDHVARSYRSLEAALPVLERFKIPLGLENHKDWTAREMVALLQKYSSEFLGVCLDFGNNISLLDNPLEAIEELAPYTVCTHLKDMGVEPDPDGFLLSEVPLGEGFLPLTQIVSNIRRTRPNVRFSLEMITRDPLKVPCLTDKYWISFPDSNGLYLARTLKFIQSHRNVQPLPRAGQLRTEDENVLTCLRFASAELNL